VTYTVTVAVHFWARAPVIAVATQKERRVKGLMMTNDCVELALDI